VIGVAATDDGLPILGVGGGDPDLIRRSIVEARAIVDPHERAARLYFLGRGLLDCDDGADDGVAVLAEAANLGSSHAAFDLAQLLLEAATTPREVQAALRMLERAASEGLVEAQQLLGEVLLEDPSTRAQGMAWLERAKRG
jgi:TPR repeat protein